MMGEKLGLSGLGGWKAVEDTRVGEEGRSESGNG